MTPQERAHLKVAVCGPHMPLIGNISMQYFAASLGYPYAGRYQEEPSVGENLDLIYAGRSLRPRQNSPPARGSRR